MGANGAVSQHCGLPYAVILHIRCAMKMLREDAFLTRYTLLSRLQNRDDQDSWKDFFDTYWRLIYSVAIQSGLTEAEAQDVVQETLITVAKDIHKFRRDRQLGSFRGWLRNVIHWRIADQLRKRTGARPEDDSKTGESSPRLALTEIPDPAGEGQESDWESAWQANLLEAAMKNVKRSVKEEHYQMFDLYVVRQWPARKVARRLEVNVGRVYLAKHRLLALIKAEARRLEEAWN
jgi:RNA polymerase sigma factor (sigma-70 family)